MHAKQWALTFSVCLTALSLGAKAQQAQPEKKTLSATEMNGLKAKPRSPVTRDARAHAVRAPIKSDTAVTQSTTQLAADNGQRTEAAQRAIAQKKIFDKLTVSNGAGRNLPEAPTEKASGS